MTMAGDDDDTQPVTPLPVSGHETGKATDTGCRRSVNEDAALVRPGAGLWAVADGMGGHAAGDFASAAVVDALAAVPEATTPAALLAGVRTRLAEANETIRRHAAQLGRGTIGATVAALLVHGRDYACLWSGDSRVYLLRRGKLVQQTRDHTEARMLLEAGAISAEEAATWPRRNVITRAIGVNTTPDLEVVGGPLGDGDVFILCSDGLTEHIADAEIADFAGRLAPQAACDALVALTLERGARDNVTVVVVRCGAP